MPLSEIIFNQVIFLGQNFWLILLPFSAVLAWQDFKYLCVNSKLAYFTCVIFALGVVKTPSESIAMCSLVLIALLVYKKFRPLSIQKIDIAFISLGILWTDFAMLTYYFFIIALFLWLLKIVFKKNQGYI
jgi:hypothetical protein